ncbi:hypothetical protein KAU45_04460 [bacterium]|nr:hypothetical protein [bacterium]
MKGTFSRLVLFVLLLLVVVASAGEKRCEVTITLTDSQAKTVQSAKGRDVVVELTDEQIKAISEGFKGFDLKEEPPTWKTLTLNTSQLHRGNTVFLELQVTEGMEDPREWLFECNPQPSP